eukprot:787356-Rhodomonas_salina.4
MSGTEIGYAAMRRVVLRRAAVSGTEIGYAAMRSSTETGDAAMQCPERREPATLLHRRQRFDPRYLPTRCPTHRMLASAYAVPGTGIAYAATRYPVHLYRMRGHGDRVLVAPKLLLPPITFHEFPEGFRLSLDFFNNDWMLDVDLSRKIPVPKYLKGYDDIDVEKAPFCTAGELLSVASAYARAMPCPVLTYRIVQLPKPQQYKYSAQCSLARG